MVFNHSEIKSILPHRFPMLLLDTVKSLEPGASIVATKNVTGNETCFAAVADGTRSASYAYPRSLIVESFGQAASIIYCVGQQDTDGGFNRVMLLGAVRHCRFHGDVFPGDTMEHRARLERSLSDAAIFSGEVWVGETRVVEIEQLIVALRPTPNADHDSKR